METTGLALLLWLSPSAPQVPMALALTLNGSPCPLKLKAVAFNLFLTSRLPTSDTVTQTSLLTLGLQPLTPWASHMLPDPSKNNHSSRHGWRWAGRC